MKYVIIPKEMENKEITILVKRNGKKELQQETGTFKGYNGSYAIVIENGKECHIGFERIREIIK